MKKCLALVICAVFLFSITSAFGSPVNLPESLKGTEGIWLKKGNLPDGMGISGAFQYDYFDRTMKDNIEINSNFISGKITVTLFDRVDVYTTLGGLVSPEAKYTDTDLKLSLSDNFMCGVGGNAVLYEWGKKDLALFADGGYRSATGVGYDSITINGRNYTSSQLSGLTLDASYKEWQVALGLSKNLSENVILFAGGQYSDAQIKGNVTTSGTPVDLGNAKSKDTFGPFVGLSFIPAKGVSIDVAGRFIDENAVSATVTIRF